MSFTAKNKASNVGAADNFGFSVAVSGDTLVVGANGESSNGTGPLNDNAGNAGAVYVFTRSGTTWSPQAYLKASNTDAGDQFGISVDLAGDTVVVGAIREQSSFANNPENNSSINGAGAIYVFDFPRRVMVISE